MNVIKIIAIFAVIAIIAGCGGPGPGTSASVTGTVVQSTTLLPIEGALVTLSGGGSATTNATGDFSITAARTGDQTLTAKASGYDDATLDVVVNSGSNDLSDPVKMVVSSTTDPPGPNGPGTIGGTVTLAGSSDASGATVTLLQGSDVVETKTTSAFGAYLIWAPVGTYTLRVEKTGYTTSEQQVQVVDLASVVTVNVTLQHQ